MPFPDSNNYNDFVQKLRLGADIADALKKTPAALSNHFKELAGAGLIVAGEQKKQSKPFKITAMGLAKLTESEK